jgi:hypothetical protein
MLKCLLESVLDEMFPDFRPPGFVLRKISFTNSPSRDNVPHSQKLEEVNG